MASQLVSAMSGRAMSSGLLRLKPVRRVASVRAALKTAPSKQATKKTVGNAEIAKAKKSSKSTFTLGFTKSNELFVGRLAMLGFAASLIGEVVTGQGALAQLGYETGLPLFEVDELIVGLIAFNLLAAILPTSQTFVPEEQEALQKRPAGPLQDPTISILTPKKFFGVTGFGFTKENELFVGRMAQLGFAASLLGEAITGKGPLAQLGLEIGIPILDAEFGILALIVFMLFAAINPGSGKFVDDGEPI